MAKSRTVNGHLKARERERRDDRMLHLIQAGKFPFTPTIMSWVSRELGKPASKITETEIGAFVKEKAAAR